MKEGIAAEALVRNLGHFSDFMEKAALSDGQIVSFSLFGRAFENWVAHEIRSYNEYAGRFEELFYWRLSTGTEVDFVVGRKAQEAIEAKASTRVNPDDLKGLGEFRVDQPSVKRRVLVSLESKGRRTEDDIEILPFDQFCAKLRAGEIF